MSSKSSIKRLRSDKRRRSQKSKDVSPEPVVDTAAEDIESAPEASDIESLPEAPSAVDDAESLPDTPKKSKKSKKSKNKDKHGDEGILGSLEDFKKSKTLDKATTCGSLGFSFLSILLIILVLVGGGLIAFYLGSVYTKKVIKDEVRSGAVDSYIIFKDILKKSCHGALYWLPYPKTPNFAERPEIQRHYDYPTAWFLSHLCENVSNSNCLEQSMPVPGDFDSSKTAILLNPELPKSIYGYVFYQPSSRTTYVSWSGTATPEMWSEDFKSVPVPVPFLGSPVAANEDDTTSTTTIKVHEGFLYIYSGIRDALIQLLLSYRSITDHYVVCGHSLGGGLSQLCALDLFGANGVLSPVLNQTNTQEYYDTLKANSFKTVTVYLFGSPRCGNLAFAAAYNQSPEINKSTFNVMNTEDLVPGFPTSGTVVEYTHVGQPIVFTANLGNPSLNHSQSYIYDLYQTEYMSLPPEQPQTQNE